MLITNYWWPYNVDSTFRWLEFAQYIDFDVITSKKPKRGFYDETIPRRGGNIFSYWSGRSGILWSLAIIRVVISKRKDYEIFIFASPPEGLIITAWLLQFFGKKVLLDQRDSFGRETQGVKWLTPVYKWFYRRLKNVVVCMKFIDPTKPVVRHGYIPVKKCKKYTIVPERVGYKQYYDDLEKGILHYRDNTLKGNYSAQVPTLKYIGLRKELLRREFHHEVWMFKEDTWENEAEKMKRVLNAVK